MRVTFDGKVPTRSGPPVFVGSSYQRGHGLGSLFRGLLRFVVPIAKSAGKTLGREALKAGVGVASDLLEGQNAEVVLQKRGKTAVKRIAKKANKKLQKGKGIGKAPPQKGINRRRHPPAGKGRKYVI